MSQTVNLNSKAMLAKLTIKQWSAHKHDRDVSLEVARTHGITTEAGRYNKALLGKHALGEIKKIVGLGRQRHYHLTLPWTDDGSRILPAKMFQRYTKEMRTLKTQFDKAVWDFQTNYRGFVTEAQTTLGDLFKSDEYPDSSEIHLFFCFEMEIGSIPAGEDFRVSIEEEQAEIIREEIENKVQGAFQTAQESLWERVRTMVRSTHERLSIYDRGNGSGKVKNPFRDSLVENLKGLIEILPDLNVGDDPDLDDITREIGELVENDPQSLRDDDLLRNQTALKAKSISDKMSAFMGETQG